MQSLDLYIFAKRELVLVLDQRVGSRRMGSGIGLDGRSFGMVGKLEPRSIHQSMAQTVGKQGNSQTPCFRHCGRHDGES